MYIKDYLSSHFYPQNILNTKTNYILANFYYRKHSRGETVLEDKPLVIPMKSNTLITAERLKEIAEKVEMDLEEPLKVENKVEEGNVPENETLDQMAVRELLQEAKKEVIIDAPTLAVPVTVKPTADGKEVFF